MKATELQINDWVYSSFFGKTKVTSLKEYEEYGWVITSGCDNWKSDTSLSPIPLTAEMLEKNGWLFIEGQDYSTFPIPSKWTYQFVPFALRIDGEHYTIANTFTIKYVHELQRALRLCGLDDLADNFQIK